SKKRWAIDKEWIPKRGFTGIIPANSGLDIALYGRAFPFAVSFAFDIFWFDCHVTFTQFRIVDAVILIYQQSELPTYAKPTRPPPPKCLLELDLAHGTKGMLNKLG
ncbi:hypothetical protein S83_038681, partial [Arachis hypogaea]